ncbi:MAG TPA: hypothetical protein P5080_04065 [Candidatus Paceibacterota bacterium]|nr:hypothetical protein [Candidatus Pacearchaeota archaeon]HRZ51143.1 hypothetical protein [Candidatus Paceibacterota bacterium]HSA36850.1 hypothetical protein [Candidatus Paceibacterota bacterium]
MDEKDEQLIDDLNYKIARNYLDLADMYMSSKVWGITPERLRLDIANEVNQDLDFAAEIIARSSGERWNKLAQRLEVLVNSCSAKIEKIMRKLGAAQ